MGAHLLILIEGVIGDGPSSSVPITVPWVRHVLVLFYQILADEALVYFEPTGCDPVCTHSSTFGLRFHDLIKKKRPIGTQDRAKRKRIRLEKF